MRSGEPSEPAPESAHALRAAVDEALDYLIHKELGQSARYFNQSGKPQFNQQQITDAMKSLTPVA